MTSFFIKFFNWCKLYKLHWSEAENKKKGRETLLTGCNFLICGAQFKAVRDLQRETRYARCNSSRPYSFAHMLLHNSVHLQTLQQHYIYSPKVCIASPLSFSSLSKSNSAANWRPWNHQEHCAERNFSQLVLNFQDCSMHNVALENLHLPSFGGASFVRASGKTLMSQNLLNT